MNVIERATPEQQVIVDRDVALRTIVDAGPGTGKTYTLTARAIALLESGALAAGTELLVLSFTRAVVGELRGRLAAHEDGAFVRPSTIDGLAARIILSVDPELPAGGHDASIRRAVELVREDSAVAGLDRFRHVIVDEFQDLVDDRLELVLLLLGGDRVGFTVLGDPAQALYDFQRERPSTENAFDTLRRTFPDAETFELSINHRARSDQARSALALRDVLRSASPSALASATEVLNRMPRLTSLGQLQLALTRADERTALLCATNGEVLELSRTLWDHGIPHTIRQGATGDLPPAWIASALGQHGGSDLSRQQFTQLYEDAADEQVMAAWRALRRIARSDTQGVSMARLRRELGRLRASELDGSVTGAPVISTIHRSKGLEYDRTIILAPDTRTPSDIQAAARVVFVGLTRSRDATRVLDRAPVTARLKQRRGRWIVVPWRKPGTLMLEVKPGDVDLTSPPNAAGDAVETQRFLREDVSPGDELELLLDGDAYRIECNGRVVGTTANAFAAVFGSGNLPQRITGARVHCVRSVAGDTARTTNLGIGTAGLWLSLEICGFAKPDWKVAS